MKGLAGILALSLALAAVTACCRETQGAVPPTGAAAPPASPSAPAAGSSGSGAGGGGATAPPPAPRSSAIAGPELSPVGLFSPVLPTLGVDTHSVECDPFEDPYEVCL